MIRYSWAQNGMVRDPEGSFVMQSDLQEAIDIIDLVATKVGGLFACMSHGMKVSSVMISEAQEAADKAFEFAAKIHEAQGGEG